MWTDVSEAGVPSIDHARTLIEREPVAVAPGSELGEGYVRLSYVCSREDLLFGPRALSGSFAFWARRVAEGVVYR